MAPDEQRMDPFPIQPGRDKKVVSGEPARAAVLVGEHGFAQLKVLPLVFRTGGYNASKQEEKLTILFPCSAPKRVLGALHLQDHVGIDRLQIFRRSAAKVQL